MEADTDRLLLIVVGAHLRAEVADRPIAYGLRDRMAERLASVNGDGDTYGGGGSGSGGGDGGGGGGFAKETAGGAAGADAGSYGHAAALFPVVCSDVWYLNQEGLHRRPVVSIGGPSVNALSAYLFPRLATALQVDQRLAVQMDIELGDLRVNLWGADAAQTAAAVEVFEKKYLSGYLRAAAV